MFVDPIAQTSNYVEWGFHSLQAITNVAVLKLAFNFYKEWNQIKERLDIIYKEFCKEHRISFVGIGK